MLNCGSRTNDKTHVSRHPFHSLLASLPCMFVVQGRFSAAFYPSFSSLICKIHLLILLKKEKKNLFKKSFASIHNRLSSKVLSKHWLSFYDISQSDF